MLSVLDERRRRDRPSRTAGSCVAAVDGGFLSVANNRVSILSEHAALVRRDRRRRGATAQLEEAQADRRQEAGPAARPRPDPGGREGSLTDRRPAHRRSRRALGCRTQCVATARDGGGTDAGHGSGCSMQPVSCSASSCSTASPWSSVVACSRATAAPSNSATASGPKRPGAVGFSGSAATPVTTLEWFRIFSLSPRPKRVWRRPDLTYDGRREPDRRRADVAVPRPRRGPAARPRTGPLELAMGQPALMGFQSWLEAGPPGPTQQL